MDKISVIRKSSTKVIRTYFLIFICSHNKIIYIHKKNSWWQKGIDTVKFLSKQHWTKRAIQIYSAHFQVFPSKSTIENILTMHERNSPFSFSTRKESSGMCSLESVFCWKFHSKGNVKKCFISRKLMVRICSRFSRSIYSKTVFVREIVKSILFPQVKYYSFLYYK